MRGISSTASSDVNRWLWRPRPLAAPRARLLCIPYAGGSATSFRTWPTRLPPDVEVLCVQLPGRGMRMGESLIRRLDEVVGVLGPLVRDLPGAGQTPLVMFGHSMGAILSFALCRWLRAEGAPLPARLIVSGHRAPHIVDPEPPKHLLDDPALIARLRHYGGTPEEILREPELVELMLPILRADFELLATHPHVPAPPLDLPMLALGGADDPNALPPAIEAWREHAGGEFAFQIFPGSHFFLHSDEAAVLSVISRELSKVSVPSA
ncbi:thioesterase II family protein [Chondromyces crocatus]|nr:alpha/beta fold hydrolase [Chondromyces crocatus]